MIEYEDRHDADDEAVSEDRAEEDRDLLDDDLRKERYDRPREKREPDGEAVFEAGLSLS
ncbi:MAG: hypothetical protein M0C28_05125 [Candidatus Moduliflexus flocculans]|nr:hypothetical protein [Candidatus Moduliflexus flocculans]